MRVAIYVRVSTQRQAQTQTIDQQLERLKRVVADRQWALPDDLIFRDDGYSGASLRCPGLDKLRALAALAKLDRILITDPDRLARNYVHQVLLMEELQRHGAQVEFADRPLSNRAQSPRNNTTTQYLLRALVSCGSCQLACSARRTMPTGRSYYICTGKNLQVRQRLNCYCSSKFIPADALDELVWADLVDLLQHPERVAQALRRASGEGASLSREAEGELGRLRHLGPVIRTELSLYGRSEESEAAGFELSIPQ